MKLLEVAGLEAGYGLLSAVRDLTLDVAPGEVLALVGANGAGKTTLLRTIAGAHVARIGSIRLQSEDVTNLPAHQRVKRGIALVPEGRRLFQEMTVGDNLRVASQIGRPGPWTIDAVANAFPFMKARWRAKAGELSGGQQQAVAISRALLANPLLLMLDEVSLGLSPAAVHLLYDSIAALIEARTTILLVEQDLRRALRVSNRVVCLLEGRIVLESATSAASHADIVAAYFGLGKSQAGAPRQGAQA
jgi:branched-chain amino acid transport system ATP-binding protein